MDTSITLDSMSYWQRLSRKIIFSALEKIDSAGLSVCDQEGNYFFGDKSAPLQADLHVDNSVFYVKVLFGGNIAAGNTWSDGLWKSTSLTNLVRVFARCAHSLDSIEKKAAFITYPINQLKHFLTRNTLMGSQHNIASHYDLGNKLYRLFLDPLMQYSSAIFPNETSTLAEAQEHKLNVICRELNLSASDHLLEIGTGWGGLAFYAAKNFGCKVTTTTISKEQYNLAKQRIDDAGLNDKVILLLKDYRLLEGQYDKIVSIEMIEAVGHEFLPTYFKTINKLLKPNGQCLIQAITIADQRYDQYRKGVDFIQAYIFPGGCLPSITRMSEQITQQTDMTISSLKSYGHDYAKTLKTWRHTFNQHPEKLEKMGYDAFFQRLWNFYFCYCEGGFLEGSIDLVHLHAKKPGARICQPTQK